MTDLGTLITACVGVMGTTGAAMRFIWNKIEKRFDSIEIELKNCRERETAAQERKAIQLTVIELLWYEVQLNLPNSPVLARAKKLLDDLKALGDTANLKLLSDEVSRVLRGGKSDDAD